MNRRVHFLALVGLVALLVGFTGSGITWAEKKLPDAEEVVENPTIERWQCRFATEIQTVDYNGGGDVFLVYADPIPNAPARLFLAGPPPPPGNAVATDEVDVQITNGPAEKANLLIFRNGTIPRNADQPMFGGLGSMPIVMFGYTKGGPPALMGGGHRVQFEQAAIEARRILTRPGLEACFEPEARKTFERLPRIDYKSTDKDAVCYFAVGARTTQTPNMVVMLDAPGMVNVKAGETVGYGLRVWGVLKRWYKYEPGDFSDLKIGLFSRLSVDTSAENDGRAFSPIFGVEWGIDITVQITNEFATDDDLINLDPRPIIRSNPPSSDPFPRAYENGDTDLSNNDWIRVRCD